MTVVRSAFRKKVIMNKSNLHKRLHFCLLTIISILLFSVTIHAGKIRLKLAVITPERTIWGKQFKVATKEIKEKTDGNVILKVYYGGIQGDEMNVIKKMRIGQLHGAGFMARGITNICPDSLVFAIPLLFHNSREVIEVHRKMRGYLEKQALSKGYQILGWTNQGFTYCFSKDKVDDLSSLRQAKPWTLESDEFCKSFFKCAGISAVPAQVGDVMTALQSGLIHTVFAPPIGMIVMQWQARVKYQLDLGIFYSFGALVISHKKWRRIPRNYQEIIRDTFRKCIEELNINIEKQNVDALNVLAKKLTVLKPTTEALEEFRSVTAKVEKDMTGKAFSPEAMKLLRQYLKEYRANLKKK